MKTACFKSANIFDKLLSGTLPASDMQNATPMLRQYLEIKKQYPGTLLFFRLGDFYEMFNEDAITGSRDRESWRKKMRKADLFDMKEEIEAIMQRLGLSGGIEFDHGSYEQLSSAHTVKYKGRTIGHVGEVDPRTLKSADLSQPVFFAELNEQVLLELCRSRGSLRCAAI